MSNLNFSERQKFEKLFEMSSGYVLDFSNRTFQEFVFDSVGLDIFAEKYSAGSGSKANRLRAFFEKEPNHVVGKLLNSILDYGKEGRERLLAFSECRQVAQRLLQDAPVQDIEAITPNANGKDFEALAKSVREAIEKNEPEAGLDRLHTFVVKYVRVLCEKHKIPTEREKPLHSCFGEYIKHLKKVGVIESEMTERILKSSISILEAFNQVRNNRSLAHDNPMLNYNESLLIFNNVSSSIRFIASLETAETSQSKKLNTQDDIPF
jgi:abortive infection Abi-like protein